jgi:ATP-dependent exoDNAse (exonuclease V) beta subunit
MSLDFLATHNKHQRDSNIDFQDEGHIYTIRHPDCPEGDRGFTSVTTFVHKFIEPFAADKIITGMMNSKRWTESKYYGMTREEIKLGWDKNRDAAADAGTKLHYDIECYYNRIEVENSSVEYGHFLEFLRRYGDLIPYRTEWFVYHEKLRFAGSIDMVFKNSDGSLDIYDWKRVKDITKKSNFNKWMRGDIIGYLPDTNYWHYALQLNIYKAILTEMYGMKDRDLYLVSLHPENKTYIRIPVTDLQDDVQLLFAERAAKIVTDKRVEN